MRLGLAICRMIVERHEGDFSRASSPHGSTFRVILPASANYYPHGTDVGLAITTEMRCPQYVRFPPIPEAHYRCWWQMLSEDGGKPNGN
jgi:hypothetical protein